MPEKVQETLRKGGGKEYNGMLTSGCGMAFIIMISHQPWLPEQDLHKIKPTQVLAKVG